ncbi:MAG: HPF/RaiA family ribosome-associated protein [Oscillospiraceae bacterium]|jgi:putative sigma-54 modulation protein|nr:HPF/RaiA family ribosome-associated protein [Oscillospiraceae bacterium]
MIVRFAAKDARLPQDILDTTEKKLHQRLDGYYRHETPDASTVLVKIAERKRVFKVEINMPYGGQLFRTENEERETPLPALDKGIDVLERQIKKHKTRLSRDLRQSLTPEEPVTLADLTPQDEDETEFKLVKVKRYAGKPMTVQDALIQMDLLGHTFYTFYNADTNSVCTAYRRNDGDYGLIELINL